MAFAAAVGVEGLPLVIRIRTRTRRLTNCRAGRALWSTTARLCTTREGNPRGSLLAPAASVIHLVIRRHRLPGHQERETQDTLERCCKVAQCPPDPG